MKPPSYLARLSFAARWMLPPEEADEVVSDYADLLEGDDRTSETLCQDFGRPWKAVSMLSQSKTYRTWLIEFCVMAAALLILMSAICWPTLLYRPFYSSSSRLHFPFLIAMFLLTFLSFRRFGALKKRLSPAFPALAVLLLLLGICTVLIMAFVTSPRLPQWMEQISLDGALQLGSGIGTFAMLAAFASALSGLWALVQARVRDRRWRALYFLAIAVLTITLCLLQYLRNMTLDASAGSWTARSDFIRVMQLAVFGLVGTGALLC